MCVRAPDLCLCVRSYRKLCWCVCVGSGREGGKAVARCVRHSDSSSPSLPCARKGSRRLTYVSCGSPLFFSNSGRSFFGFLCCCFDIHSEKERKNRAGWLDVRMHPVLCVCECVYACFVYSFHVASIDCRTRPPLSVCMVEFSVWKVMRNITGMNH